jgi:valyl-tRNA synthetase
MIDSRYQPREIEGRIYAAWEDAGAFRAGRPERAKAQPYCIVIPPPNVTGSLHMGHALNNTLQDILCRFERMRGKDVLWQPGMDHAGIATQAVVERQLAERQQPSSREMGREAFIKRVWEWKAESGGTITSQLKRLGASCDWSRERFTMDEGLSRAVMKVFVALYREGLIYKDKRLVNWDPKLKTAISDLEVQQVETKGQLWHIKYPIEGSSEFIVVATTRPETMLGDVAVAVHPHNERLKHLIGKTAILPLVGRRIPVIADEYADPEKGSGAVKITPAHDFNDFEVGRRHDLPIINVLTAEGRITFAENVFHREGQTSSEFEETKKLEGVDRFEARKKIVERLEAAGLLDKIEPTTHVVPHGDRSGAVLEPYLTDQWYVDAKTLAQPAMAAVRERKTVFVPPQWEATFFNWMENIQPWCISRQIWWGHQIPAWYGPWDGKTHKIFVAETAEEARAQALEFYRTVPLDDGKPYAPKLQQVTIEDRPIVGGQSPAREDCDKISGIGIVRDPDVLDTWFSSALWPFSTLGWPAETAELKRFYPTSTLVTGFDIIFFWVARMMMMGLHFMQKERPDAPSDQWVPFHDVYIHALVRDERGQKMSKSKGNVIDPLAVIDEYGADALRFTLAAMAAQGRDIKLSAQRVEGYRNFATKLWNAARFAEINGCVRDPAFDPRKTKEVLNRWIAHETASTARQVTAAIEAYKFNDAAAALYRFVWNVYCDWYLELIKPVLTGPDGAAKNETRAAAAWALDQIFKLLHPFMPFVTEELWAVTASLKRDSLLALTEWPSLEAIGDARAEAEMGWVIDLITAIRSVRAEMNVNVPLPLVMVRVGDHVWDRAQRWSEFIGRMAKISDVTKAPTHKPGTIQLVVRGETVGLVLSGLVDLPAERARLAKEMAKCDADIARVEAKLGNPNFVARAPEEVVEEEKEKREEAQLRKTKIAEALQRLEGAA